jgi:UPF0271 protein
VKLNCDIGESFGIWKMGRDEDVMPCIDLANIACGFHASDPSNISKSISLALENRVTIGAHISYLDLLGFGRRSIAHTYEEIRDLSIYQLGALDALCKLQKTEVSYVKPHGALYNDMMKDFDIFKALAKSISEYNQNIKLMILATKDTHKYKELANECGIELLLELFADRAYDSNGHLVSRKESGSVLNSKEILSRVKEIAKSGKIKTIENKFLELKADTLCIHGDNEESIELAKEIKSLL